MIYQILIHQLNFVLSTGKIIFKDLNFNFSQHKIGLIGRNGIGKSTLLNLITHSLKPQRGSIQVDGQLAYVPQNPTFSENETIADFLGFAEKLNALNRIELGSVNENDFAIVGEDWDVKEKVQSHLSRFGLDYLPHQRLLKELSGGEITRLFLIKAIFSNPDFLLLDEPTNHLDSEAKIILYEFVKTWKKGLIIISHDRGLLELMDEIVEISTLGLARYGGNYTDYFEQKQIEKAASELKLHDARKLFRKTTQTIQSSREKHEKRQSYGKALRKSGSIDKMAANSKKGKSERTQSKLLIKENRLIEQAESKFQEAIKNIEIIDEIHIKLPKTHVPHGKMILDMEDLCFSYPQASRLIINDVTFKIYGPERIALQGKNGSGKTTLINLIMNQLKPCSGNIRLGTQRIAYLDQNVSLLNPELSILDNFLKINPDSNEKSAHFCLASFLFKNITAKKLVKELSGGEKLRALLACLLQSTNPPQLLILDEPTNHLDLTSIASIESALANFEGALLVVSHDEHFLKNIGITRKLTLTY